MNNTDQYKQIIKKLIDEAYYEISPDEIRIKEVKKSRFYALALHKGDYFELIINKKVKKWKLHEKISMLAHELGHFVIYKKVGYIITKISDFLEGNFRFFRSLQERLADKIAIEKGYGSYMIKSRKNPKSVKRKHRRTVYMTPDEMKEYITTLETRGI